MKSVEDHFSLLNDIDAISDLLKGSPDLQGFLDRVVRMIADHLGAHVCSIYLFDDHSHILTLRATHGLSADSVGEVQLKVGEGLVGKVLQEQRPICVAHASDHPDFKFFPETGEASFEAFLGIPIQRGQEKIGVLVVQRCEPQRFSNVEIMAMRALTSQLANAIDTARALLQIASPSPPPEPQPASTTSCFITGTTGSPGFVIGESMQFTRHPVERILDYCRSHTSECKNQQDILDQAIERTLDQLAQLQQELGAKLPEMASLIFEAHLMMLKDRSFTKVMADHVADGASAMKAVSEAATHYIKAFRASEHEYLREKAQDVEDLALRLIQNITGETDQIDINRKGKIIIARELLPSDILQITMAEVGGIILLGGGLTSHISILVRSLAIPMVLTDHPELSHLEDGSTVLLDADAGNAYIRPTKEIIQRFEDKETLRNKSALHGKRMLDATSTKDGTRIKLMANINLLSELDMALEMKAEGIGLYRTEFPFLIRQSIPSEEEQFKVYSKLLAKMDGRETIIRTLDAGGDKVMPYFHDGDEPNPALGLRSTRLMLKHADIFDQQIRALLRAADSINGFRILFPMISSMDEFYCARQRVEDCLERLRKDTGKDMKRPSIGVMVELPAAVDLADAFAEEADFLSIGTNDFIQYMLGVDRDNARVLQYYCPHHPSVLRGLKRVAEAATRHGKDCTICGEMAHDARYIPFFLGIGIRQLSVDPNYLPDVQTCIGKWSLEHAVDYARQLLELNTIRQMEEALEKFSEGDLPL